MSSIPLPNEILLDIFCKLDLRDVFSSFLVNRQFHNAITSNWDRMQKLKVQSITIYGCERETTISINSFSLSIEISSTSVQLEYLHRSSSVLQSLFKQFFLSQDNCQLKETPKWSTRKIWSYPITNREEALRQVLTFILSNITADQWVMLILAETNCLIDCVRRHGSRHHGRPYIAIPQITAGFADLCNAFESSNITIMNDAELKLGVHLLDTSRRIMLKINCIDNIDGIYPIFKGWKSGQRKIQRFEIYINSWHKSDQMIRHMNLDDFTVFMEKFNADLVFTTKSEKVYHLKRSSDTKVLKISYSIPNMLYNRQRYHSVCTHFSAQEITFPFY